MQGAAHWGITLVVFHGRGSAVLRKIPGALSLRPVPPVLFLIMEVRGVAGMDQARAVLAFIPAEAAHRLAPSLLQHPQGRGSVGGTLAPAACELGPWSAGFN